MTKAINFKWNNKKYTISQNQRPLVIAEAGVNHNGNVELALELIDLAKKTGSDVVKFQSFITEEISTPTSKAPDYIKRNVNLENWQAVLKGLELSQKDQAKLFNYCLKKGIVFLSTPYDYKSADFLGKLGVPMFKIASTDTTNIPFIEYVARKGKPMIISTGLSTFEDAKDAVAACKRVGNDKIIIMQCTTNYPASVEAANIKVISAYRDRLDVLVGYSDHTNSELTAILAVGEGAVAFEHHFTKDRNMKGPDHIASTDPESMKRYIQAIHEAYVALGDGVKRVMPEEIKTKRTMQKSLTSTREIKKGDIIKKEDILIKRPATGLAPKLFNKIVGKRAAKNIKADIPVMQADVAW